MLSQLQVRNFALVDELSIDLHPGMVVLTGETGSGKSILLDAIRFVLGERLDSIRLTVSDSKASWVEAVFEIKDKILLKNESLQSFLEDETCLIFRRELTTDGKSKCSINQRTVNTSTLKQLGALMLDIHGQYDHQLLLDPEHQMKTLDALNSKSNVPQEYLTLYKEYAGWVQKKRELEEQVQNRERELDLLKYQIDEIEKAELQENEDVELQQEKIRLSNSEKLYEITQKLNDILDQREESASSLISEAAKELSHLIRLDASMGSAQGELEAAQLHLEELIRRISDYQETLSFEPGRLDEIESRLARIKLMKKKYGPEISEILAFLDKTKQRYDELINSQAHQDEAQKHIHRIKPRLLMLAKEWTQQRKKAAALLKKSIENELQDLSMIHSKFECEFTELEEFSNAGLDQMEFFMQINPGQPLMPLKKLVSAGETSRIMLAIKKTLAKVDSVETLIFDEIDANIGGRLGTITGEKLKEISKERQVLVITHLPQIASFGDQHIKVSKGVKAGKTLAQYRMIDGDERVKELSEMMSGKQGSQHAKDFAQEMLVQGSQKKG